MMAAWFAGVIPKETALKWHRNWEMSKKFKETMLHSLLSLLVGQLFAGSSWGWWRLQLGAAATGKRAANPVNFKCLCRTLWRWICCLLGQSHKWWRQQCSPRSAKRCSADPGHRLLLCSFAGRWASDCLGFGDAGWRCRACTIAPAKRVPDRSVGCGVRSNQTRWDCGDLGCSRQWRGLLQSLWWASKCEAYCCQQLCIRCNPCRWNCGDMGSWIARRW